MAGMRGIAGSVLVVVAASVIACAPTTTLGDSDAVKPERACFNANRARNFSPLHERFVYVEAAYGERYLLTLDAVYMGLPYATGIAISGSFSRVCSDTGATLAFRDAGRITSCRVIRVEAVASREEAERVVRDRTTPRPKG